MDIYYKKTRKTGEEPRIVMELSIREAILIRDAVELTRDAVEIVDPDEDEDRGIAEDAESSLSAAIERALES